MRRLRGVIAAVTVLAVPLVAQAPASAGATTRTGDARTVVCAPSTCDLPGLRLRNGDRLLLRPGIHRGPLDLRNVTGVTVSGQRGAVLDARGSRYALSLRDARDLRVEGLVLRGGTAQTLWVERSRRVVLAGLRIEGSRGSGVQVRETDGFTLSASTVTGSASAGVMELGGVRRSRYERLLVSGNGRGTAPFDGDGLQLSGSSVIVRDVVVTGNGSSSTYEHGVYVSSRARGVHIVGLQSRGNSGAALKLGGSGRLERSTLVDERLGLYCGSTAGTGWSVRSTKVSAPSRTVREASCLLTTA